MPRMTAAESAKTADRILQVAVARFSTDGYTGASLDDIARDAGVTRGAVYHHYRDKPGLLRAAVLEGHTRVAAYVVDRAEAHSDPADQLRAGCHAFIEAITGTDTARLLLLEAPAALGWATWRELDAATSGRELHDAIAALPGTRDVDSLTQLLSGAMNEAALWLVDRSGDPETRAAVHRSLDLLLTAVTGPAER